MTLKIQDILDNKVRQETPNQEKIYIKDISVENQRLYSGPLSLTAYSGLERLDVHNNLITSVDLTANLVLKELNCSKNELKVLNLTENWDLTKLLTFDNQIKNLYLGQIVNLTHVNVSNNRLTGVFNLTLLSNLKHLNFADNRFNGLKIHSPSILNYLNCSNNDLTNQEEFFLALNANPINLTLELDENSKTILNERRIVGEEDLEVINYTNLLGRWKNNRMARDAQQNSPPRTNKHQRLDSKFDKLQEDEQEFNNKEEQKNLFNYIKNMGNSCIKGVGNHYLVKQYFNLSITGQIFAGSAFFLISLFIFGLLYKGPIQWVISFFRIYLNWIYYLYVPQKEEISKSLKIDGDMIVKQSGDVIAYTSHKPRQFYRGAKGKFISIDPDGAKDSKKNKKNK
jgi:hypothetical protein